MYKWIQQIVFDDMNLNVALLIITGYSFLSFHRNIQNAEFGHFLSLLWATFSDNHTVSLTVDCRAAPIATKLKAKGAYFSATVPGELKKCEFILTKVYCAVTAWAISTRKSIAWGLHRPWMRVTSEQNGFFFLFFFARRCAWTFLALPPYFSLHLLLLFSTPLFTLPPDINQAIDVTPNTRTSPVPVTAFQFTTMGV